MNKSITLLVCGWLMFSVAAMAGEHAQADKQGAKSTKTKPTLAVGAAMDGNERLWLAKVQNQKLLVSYSDDLGQHFSAPVEVNSEPENIGADGENRPKIAFGRDGTLHLTWTKLLAQPYTGEIRYSRSTDGGKTFTTPVTLNDDKRLTSHRFDSLATDGGDALAVVWLDGRDRDAAKEQGETFTGVSVYYARSDNNGASFSANRRLAKHTCECCQTSLAWTAAGPIALWRNVFDANTRDFAIAKLDEGVVRRATDDDWRIDACPHHGGGIAVDGRGVLHMVWFTDGSKRRGLFYKQIKNDQESPPMAIGNLQSQAGHALVAAAGSTVLISWREFDGQGYAAMAMRSSDGGASWSAPKQLATTAAAADYPVPLLAGNDAMVVWNTAADGLRVLPFTVGGGK